MLTVDNKNTIEYISAGLFNSDQVWCHPRRCIDTYEIIFMLEGCAYINESGYEYTLTQNDILLLDCQKEHYGFQPSTEKVSFFWIHFKVDDEAVNSLPKFFSVSEPYLLKNLFSQCLHICNTSSYDKVCADLYTALIIHEIKKNFKESSSSSNYLATRIREWIRVNIDKNITLTDIAYEFSLHPNHISRVFKQTYGIGIKKHINSEKLKKSQSLLLTTHLNIKQISLELSFQSENHFIKFFKYHTKITPSEYRNSYTNTHTNKK